MRFAKNREDEPTGRSRRFRNRLIAESLECRNLLAADMFAHSLDHASSGNHDSKSTGAFVAHETFDAHEAFDDGPFLLQDAPARDQSSQAGSGSFEAFGFSTLSPPKVASIKVGSSDWSSAFLGSDQIDGNGYTIPSGGEQLAPLPWTNVDEIIVEFSSDVGSISSNDIRILGGNDSQYHPLDIAYSNTTNEAVISFAEPFPLGRFLLVVKDSVTDIAGNRLDGEWNDATSLGLSGNDEPGGSFLFRFNILPGDINQTGAVAVSDLGGIRVGLGKDAAHENYSVMADLDGSGGISVSDVAPLRSHLGLALPTAEPTKTDLSISIEDGVGFSFPNVPAEYQLSVTNRGSDDALATSVNHRTAMFENVTWTKTTVPGGIPFDSQIDVSSFDGTNGFSIVGANNSDKSGNAVNAIGDVNDDGFDDLIVGASSANAPLTDSGQAYVVFGSADGFPAAIDATQLNGTNGFRIDGDDASLFAGHAVGAAGDLNDDGISDLFVSSKFSNSENAQVGATYVVFGNAQIGASGSIAVSSLDGTTGFAILGIDGFDRSGEAVSSLGDVNDDGVDDLLIGAAEADPIGSRSGESYVVFGTSGIGADGTLGLETLDGSNGFVITGVAPGDYSGRSVSRAGDVNADGVVDLLIGSPLAKRDGVEEVGEAYLLFGGPNLGSAGQLELSTLDGTNGVTFASSNAFSNVGSSVGAAGDINDDGIDDVIIGATGASPDNDRSMAGRAYIVFGSPTIGDTPSFDVSIVNGVNGFVLNGVLAGDGLGNSVAGELDMNGDGIDDMIVGASLAASNSASDSGSAYVIFGRGGMGSSGTIEASELDGLDGFSLTSSSGAIRLGSAVSFAGDFNADGIGDMIIGAERADPLGRTDAGETYVLFGQAAPVRTITSGSGEINETVDLTSGTLIEYQIRALTPAHAAGIVFKTASVSNDLDWSISTDINLVSNNLPTFEFAQSEFAVFEDNTMNGMEVTLHRSGEMSFESEIQIQLNGSGANPATSADYDSAPIDVVFAFGETTKTVTVPIEQDFLDEADESIELTLVPVSLAIPGTQVSTQLSILDDDTAGVTIVPVDSQGGAPIAGDPVLTSEDNVIVFEVSLESQPTNAVDVLFSLDETGLLVDDNHLSVYHIGNSLMYDARPDLFAHTSGHHLDWGKSLDHISDHPTEADSTGGIFGSYQPALDGFQWDYVALQPYPSSTSTLDSDVAVFQEIASLEPNARLLLFEAWPNISNADFDDAWNQNVPTDPVPTRNRVQYYSLLRAELNSVGIEYDVVPVGDIFASIHAAIEEGAMPELTAINELYRDGLHLSMLGQMVTHSALHFAVSGELPATLPFNHSFSNELLSALNSHIQAIVVPAERSGNSTSIAFNDQNWNLPQYVEVSLEPGATTSEVVHLIATTLSDDPLYSNLLSDTSVATVNVGSTMQLAAVAAAIDVVHELPVVQDDDVPTEEDASKHRQARQLRAFVA